MTEWGDRMTEWGDQMTEWGDRMTECGDRMTERGDRMTDMTDLTDRGDNMIAEERRRRNLNLANLAKLDRPMQDLKD